MEEDDGGVENIAYAVPAMILKRCLEDYLEQAVAMGEGKGAAAEQAAAGRRGAAAERAGLPMLGLRWQRTESEAMRGALGLPLTSHQGGDRLER